MLQAALEWPHQPSHPEKQAIWQLHCMYMLQTWHFPCACIWSCEKWLSFLPFPDLVTSTLYCCLHISWQSSSLVSQGKELVYILPFVFLWPFFAFKGSGTWKCHSAQFGDGGPEYNHNDAKSFHCLCLLENFYPILVCFTCFSVGRTQVLETQIVGVWTLLSHFRRKQAAKQRISLRENSAV